MQQNKGISAFSEKSSPRVGRNHLFLIGIAKKYQHWKPLQYPVSDCEKLAALLQRRYGFEAKPVRFLREEEATCEVIYDDLYNLLNNDEAGEPLFSDRDNLVLVFSGHGHLDENLDQGYWTPVDAPVPAKPNDLKKLISVDEVAKILSKVRAQHIVLIVDACFPLKFAHIELDVLPGGAGEPEEMPSRWVLTSGRKEPVPDKSLFSESLLQILEKNTDAQLSIKWLGAQIEHRVRQQKGQPPWFGSLTQNQRDGGEFCFNLKKTAPGYVMELSAFAPPLIFLDEHLRRGSQEYFDRLQKGRFRFLQIQKLLLPHADLPELIHTEVQLGEQTTYLFQALELLQSREKRHAVILGEGGMGKTVSLVQLWKVLLFVGNASHSQAEGMHVPIPIFIALNEFNAVPEHEQEDFLVRYLAKNYLGLHTLTDEWKNALWQTLTEPLPGGKPRYLLLLDGFNEVTVPKEKLSISLNRLNEKAAGVQMVMTSRFVEIQNFTWAHRSEILRLQPLSPAQIEDYLKEYLPSMPTDKTLLEQLANPMMLTLFAGSSSIAKRWEGDRRFRFLPVASFGELLWNFNEAQLASHFEECQDKPGEQAWHLFLLRCLVPYLAWRMEKEGQFFIPTRKSLDPRFNFKTVLDEAFRDLDTEALTEVFPSFEGNRSLLGFGIPDTLDAREQRSLRVRTWLVEKLHCLVPEGDTLRFVHQNFRDFFAAVHLLNEIDVAAHSSSLSEQSGQAIPPSWTERTFPIYLRRMLGNIEGEHHFEAKKFAKGLAMPGFQAESRLARLLDGCRGIFYDEQVRYAVWNVAMIAADGRETLAGMNLERLDLRMLYLNGISLSKHLGDYQYLPARLKGCILWGKQLFPQGHYNIISNALYSSDGKKILTASLDGTIKEWSVETGECLQTLDGHQSGIWSAVFSADGKKILSSRDDGTMKEWSVETGECLQTFSEFMGNVYSASYSVDGKKILSSGDNGTIKEWSVETGECLQTFGEPTNSFYSMAVYSADGKKVLSSRDDWTIKEWSVETGECLQTLTGHGGVVRSVCYSTDGEKILSASDDYTVKEWLVKTGKCLRTFEEHTSKVWSAIYNADGNKVLSASNDATVKEWSVETGECLQTLSGHTGLVRSVKYSPNCKKALSASNDGTVRVWSMETGKCIQLLSGHKLRLISTCYSVDGKKVLAYFADNTIKEWSTEDGNCLQILTLPKDLTGEVMYSADGKRVKFISTDDESTVTVIEWLVQSGECMQSIKPMKDETWLNVFLDRIKPSCLEKPDVRPFFEQIVEIDGSNAQSIFFNVPGIYVWVCDFTALHEKSKITEEEKKLLRMYGAII